MLLSFALGDSFIVQLFYYLLFYHFIFLIFLFKEKFEEDIQRLDDQDRRKKMADGGVRRNSMWDR